MKTTTDPNLQSAKSHARSACQLLYGVPASNAEERQAIDDAIRYLELAQRKMEWTESLKNSSCQS